MPNIKVNINVGFSETEESVTEKGSVERLGDGSFKLVIGHDTNLILIAWKAHFYK